MEGHRHEQASPQPLPGPQSCYYIAWVNITRLPHEVVQVDGRAIRAPKQSWEL